MRVVLDPTDIYVYIIYINIENMFRYIRDGLLTFHI